MMTCNRTKTTRFYGLKVNGEIVDVISVNHEYENSASAFCGAIEYQRFLNEKERPGPERFPLWRKLAGQNDVGMYYLSVEVVMIDPVERRGS